MFIRSLSLRTLPTAGALVIAAFAPITDVFAQESHSADVVQRIRKYRTELALSEDQVAKLTTLEATLREETGRQVVVARDRVPGKFVPRYERRRPSRADALRQALKVLTPEQRAKAVQVLEGSSQ
jgi:hypothetical protein